MEIIARRAIVAQGVPGLEVFERGSASDDELEKARSKNYSGMCGGRAGCVVVTEVTHGRWY